MREIVFGFEDGVVSTMGVVTGIAEGTHDKFTVLLAGVVVVAVESLSMAAGTYLSTKSHEQALAMNNLEQVKTRAKSKDALRGALVMGVTYVIGGIIPVLPYGFLPLSTAIIVSVAVAIVMLFIVGAWKAKLTKTSVFAGAMEMVVISFSAAALGFLIGKVAGDAYPQIREAI
jgi:predicted membrane protein (TIGR00267 family)